MNPSPLSTLAIAELVYNRAKALHRFAHYTGILTLNGLARLALVADNAEDHERLLQEAQLQYQPFLEGKAEFSFCNFECYRSGGSGSAYLWWKGELPNGSEAIFQPYIDELLNDAPRDRNGTLCHPKKPEAEIIWIDIAFAVTPFLLYCGLKLKRDDLIHQAWMETKLLIDALYVPATGLVNQAINFRKAGQRSDDHWSRGNGWAIHGLAALIEAMPQNHPDRAEVEQTYIAFVDACLKLQDPKSGLWHQEMTAPESFIETSGSGLILHGIGVGIEQGLLSSEYRQAFEHGIRGYLSYIALDGSIHNTCVGCLSPGEGTKDDYINYPHNHHDCHAYGPAIFAFAQAHAIGIKTITI